MGQLRELGFGSSSFRSGSAPGSTRLSRASGLRSSKGTFGSADRFGRAERSISHGAHSPWGEKYYSKSRFFSKDEERGRQPSLGVGDRPQYASGFRNVGPGSYEIVASRAKARSPLDGPDFCNVTMKSRQKIVVGQQNPADKANQPGPGQYEVRPKPGDDAPKYHFGLPLKDLPDDGMRESHSASQPSLARPERDGDDSAKAKAGNQVARPYSFGMADRFGGIGGLAGQAGSSPSGELYYSHIKILQKDDYIKQCRACSLGSGQRANLGASQHLASPASYGDLIYFTSAAKATSPLDGMVDRNLGNKPGSRSGVKHRPP